jgi:hypothetical protein
MDASNAYRVRIIGDEAVAQELSAYAAAHPDEMHVVSSERDEDPTRLGYTLTEVVAVVLTVAKTIVSSAQLAKKLSEWLQKSKGNKIVIQFPGQTLEFTKSSKISPEEIQKLLQAASALNR